MSALDPALHPVLSEYPITPLSRDFLILTVLIEMTPKPLDFPDYGSPLVAR